MIGDSRYAERYRRNKREYLEASFHEVKLIFIVSASHVTMAQAVYGHPITVRPRREATGSKNGTQITLILYVFYFSSIVIYISTLIFLI